MNRFCWACLKSICKLGDYENASISTPFYILDIKILVDMFSFCLSVSINKTIKSNVKKKRKNKLEQKEDRKIKETKRK